MSLSSDRARCLAVTFRQHVQPSRFTLHVFDLFISFKYINVTHQHNSWLSQAIQNCYLIGHVEPYLLLIGGSSAHLQTIKLSWDRGQLKSPFGFSINSVSDVGSWLLETSQFNAMRLEEVICQLVWQVTQSEPSCSVERLVKYLEDVYRGIQLPVPSLNDVNNSLAVLTQAGAIYFSGHGYNLLTPEKLAVAKWLESIPETCTDTESVLDYPISKTAPLAEIEPFGRNASLSDPVNRCDLVQNNDQLRNAKHKIGNSTYYRNASALVPVPENLELEHLLRSFSAHSISSYHLRRNHINHCNPVVFVSPTNSLKYLNSQFPSTYKTNDINSNYVMKSARENVIKFSSAGVSDSLKSHTARSEIKLPHHSQMETPFTKCTKIPSNKKFNSPGFLKWLLDRFQHLRLSWRPSRLSCVEDQIMHPQKDEYYVPSHPANQPPQNHAISYDSFSTSNLRRCFSLSDGGKSNKTNDQIIKNCSSCMEASFSSGILNAEINGKGSRKRSSCPSKQLHLSSQKDIHGNHSVASLTVSSVSFSKNHFLSQNHGIKSVPRLITSPHTLVRNSSKNSSNFSIQHSGRTSTMRDSGFVEGLHRPFISGSFIQSNFSKSSESSRMHHDPRSDSLRKASINSSNLWWYIGSSRLAPSIKASRPQFITSNNM
ncbi:unnamed protein product [Schistosoma haematobium]|nr:unnamed protein product [Schistosoma haematobium]CAH8678329.1 unnamed protein product [Schistosoma haematobium]